MFTGLIEEVGTVSDMAVRGRTIRLAVEGKLVMDGMRDGDSIAVNGVCLTVTGFDAKRFYADVMPETFTKTALSDLSVGDPVNLERAMAADGRFGGHIVQGHVDCTGRIVRKQPSQNAVHYHIEPEDPVLFRYIIPQGSVTIDGISLTVAGVDTKEFFVSIIPHTLKHTQLQYKSTGDRVNLEGDILGKYVYHLLGNRQDRKSAPSMLTADFLSEHGFMG